jgi:hypothetical protein
MRPLRKLRKSRKAMIFNIFLVIIMVVFLTYGYIRITEKHDKIKKEIGEHPMEVVTKVQEGEKALIFLDFAAQMAIYQAAYDLQAQGGISNATACGTYYGFNSWNAAAGKTCFVDSSTAKDSLKDLFVSNLVARVAAYPSADFIGNVPTAAFARGLALTAGQPATTLGTPSEAPKCTAGQEVQKDFTYPSTTGFHPPNGSRVWVPAEANCKGSYPLIVWMHGCQKRTTARSHVRFGDGHRQDIIPQTRKLIKEGKVQPVILAAPSQTKGAHGYYGVKNSPCGFSLWGEHFDHKKFVKLVSENLPEGITISSVSFMGHSGAGCGRKTGIHSAATAYPDALAIGQWDTCSKGLFGTSLKQKLGTNTKFIAIYANMGKRRDEQNKAMGITKKITCPKTEITGGSMDECYSDEQGKWFGLKTVSRNHGRAVSVGTDLFLRMFFPAAPSAPAVASATKPATTTPSAVLSTTKPPATT